MQEIEFEIDRDAVRRYSLTSALLSIAIPLVFLVPWILITLLARLFSGDFFALILLFKFTIIFGIVLAGGFVFGYWLCPQQVKNLRYRLEGNTLRADGGVFFLFRKSIPLERITDVALVQGPLLRYFNIWAMRIQTAGSAQCEATLWGVREPEKIRELILAQRQGVYGEKTNSV